MDAHKQNCLSCAEAFEDMNMLLLPCLHVICARCVGDIVVDAAQKEKRPGCVDCGEFFEPETLLAAPNFKNVRSLQASFCQAHPTQNIVGYCIDCARSVCTCGTTVHGSHVCVSMEAALAQFSDATNAELARALNRLADVDTAIARHKKNRTRLQELRLANEQEDDADLRNQEKAKTLVIDDLELTKAFILVAKDQAESLAQTYATLPLATRVSLQRLVAERLKTLCQGVVHLLAPQQRSGENLDRLPPSDFNLDEWKRLHANRKDETAIQYFWDNYDPDGYSIWKCHYIDNPIRTHMIFMSSNLAMGFFQRIEMARAYSFGSLAIFGQDGNTEIHGIFLFRGHDIPEEVKNAIDFESYEFTMLNEYDAQTRLMFNAFLAGREIANIASFENTTTLPFYDIKYFR